MHGLVSRIAIGVFGLLTIAMVLLAIFDDHGALNLREQREKRDKIQMDNEELERKNQKLHEEIDKLRRNDPEEMERRARERLKMIKPGEVQIQIPSPPAEQAPED